MHAIVCHASKDLRVSPQDEPHTLAPEQLRVRIAREVLGQIDWNHGMPADAPRRFKPPRYDSEELLGVMPMDHKRPVNMKEVIARIADDSEFLEFGENYGGATVCGHIKIEGWPLGVITNNGPIDPAGATLVAGGEPEIPDLDTAFRTDDAQHIVLPRHDRAGHFGDDAV